MIRECTLCQEGVVEKSRDSRMTVMQLFYEREFLQSTHEKISSAPLIDTRAIPRLFQTPATYILPRRLNTGITSRVGTAADHHGRQQRPRDH